MVATRGFAAQKMPDKEESATSLVIVGDRRRWDMVNGEEEGEMKEEKGMQEKKEGLGESVGSVVSGITISDVTKLMAVAGSHSQKSVTEE